MPRGGEFRQRVDSELTWPFLVAHQMSASSAFVVLWAGWTSRRLFHAVHRLAAERIQNVRFFCFCCPVGGVDKSKTFPRRPQARRRADSSGNWDDVHGLAFAIVAAQAAGAVEDGVGAVVVLADLDPRFDKVGAQRARRDLQFQPVE